MVWFFQFVTYSCMAAAVAYAAPSAEADAWGTYGSYGGAIGGYGGYAAAAPAAVHGTLNLNLARAILGKYFS